MGPLSDLAEAVQTAYLKELKSLEDQEAHAEISLVTGLSVEFLDLKSGRTSYRPSVSKLELYASWKYLMSTLQRLHVFLDYLPLLKTAFSGIDSAKSSDYRSLKTLVHLLSNTAENSHRDNSTDCRFVTLLEVMLSYQDGWEPSEQVSKAWVRLMQRIPTDVPKINFRRKAYRVLVSLSWVPSSKGLLAACSFEDNRKVLESDKSPKEVKAHFKRIRNSPLPRYDCVNQLLDRLKDETDVCVAIRSEREGCGKTTLAALLASHSSILRVFRVLWVPIQRQKITYSLYSKLLSNICEQLGFEPSWPEYVARFEEPAFQRLRESQYMEEARAKMAEILASLDENVLIILDDVQDAKQIESFRFDENQSMIVTTLDAKLDGVDWTVELDPLSEEEAIELFLSEADLSLSHILGCTNEIKEVVRRCDCHPLTVRSAARSFQLKQTTAGISKGMEELVRDFDEIAQLSNGESSYSDPQADLGGRNEVVFDLLRIMMSPSKVGGKGRSSIFFLCFSAMVVVFPGPVPLDSVLLLWNRLLEKEPEAVDALQHISASHDGELVDIRKYAWFIAEGLTHMGVITVMEKEEVPWVQAHHQLYEEFAVVVSKEMDLGDDTAKMWNQAFVTAYYEHRIQHGEPEGDDSLSYATSKLPAHMFTAKMFTTGVTVLSDEGFFQARVDTMGWNEAVETHVADCVKLQYAVEAEDPEAGVSPVFARLAVLVGGGAVNDAATVDDSVFNDVSHALYQIAFALAKTGFYEEALVQFEKARELLPQSEALQASILYGASWALWASGDLSKAMKKIKACRKAMEDCPRPHALQNETLQVMGDILVANCEYKGALDCYDELNKMLRPELPKSQIDLGSVLYKKGRLLQLTNAINLAKNDLMESVSLKEEISECSENMAEAYSALGDALLELRQTVEARQQFEKAITVYSSLKVPVEATRLRLVTGKLRHLHNDEKGSTDMLMAAHEAIRSSPVILMDVSAYELRLISVVYKKNGELDMAVSVLHDSLALTDNRPFSLERSCALLDLGSILLDQNQVVDGLECLEQALEIRIVKLGECILVLETLKLVGNVHLSQGDHLEALKVFRKVHEVALRIAPDNIELIGGALFAIGEVFDAQGRFDLAMENFVECKRVVEEGRDQDHPDVAKAFQRLGELFSSQDKLEQAELYFTEALRIRKMNFDEALLAETLHSMGVLLRKLNRIDYAEEMLVQALEIRSNLDLDRETGESLLEIGNIYRIKKDMDSAVSVFEKGKDILGEDSDLLGCVYLASGHAMLSLGRDEEARFCYLKAREIRLEAYGKDSPKYGNASRSLGIVNYLLGSLDEALVCLNEFVRIFEADLEGTKLTDDEEDEEEEEETENLDYVLCIVLLGDINVFKGRLDQAENVWAIAQEICDDNEEIIATLPDLAGMLAKRTGNAGKDGKGFLSRFQDVVRLSEEEGPAAEKAYAQDPKEIEILRNVLFIDD